MIIHLKHHRLHISWWVVVAMVVCCAITIRLAFWQLDRADQKRALIAQWEAKSLAPSTALSHTDIASPRAFDRDTPQSLHLTQVNWTGKPLMDNIFLLDNRMRGQKAGFEVLVPIENSKGYFLLNIGWIEKQGQHYAIPPLPTFTATQGEGHIYIPPPAMVLKTTPTPPSWPKIVQSIEFTELSQNHEKPLMPFTVRVKNSDNTGLNVEWPSLRLQPEKNMGYALQWFLISVALFIGFTASGIRSKTAHEPTVADPTP